MTRYYDLTLQLADVQDLFAPPESDPFDEQVRFDSGIDRLIDDLKPTALVRKVRTTIVLPVNQIEVGLEDKIRGALERYCRHKIQQNQRELSSLRWKGIKALQNGLIFLAACLLLSTAAENAEFLPEFLRRFLGEGLLIVGWVSLWHPVEVLLYEWWPPSRENQLYNSLRRMEIVIKTRA